MIKSCEKEFDILLTYLLPLLKALRHNECTLLASLVAQDDVMVWCGLKKGREGGNGYFFADQLSYEKIDKFVLESETYLEAVPGTTTSCNQGGSGRMVRGERYALGEVTMPRASRRWMGEG